MQTCFVTFNKRLVKSKTQDFAIVRLFSGDFFNSHLSLFLINTEFQEFLTADFLSYIIAIHIAKLIS